MSKKNLANAILAAPVAAADTSATLVTGYGATMPAVPFKMTLTPFGQLSTMGNSEIVLVTARTGEVLTIERAKGGTTAKDFEAGDIVSNGIYIENSVAVGDIFISLRATPSVGRLFMDGATYSKSDYPIMYKFVQDNPAYGTTGGTVGAETFTLADMRERMPFGKSQNTPFTTLGSLGGAATHVLTAAEMPSHTHANRWRVAYPRGTASLATNDLGGDAILVSDNMPGGDSSAGYNPPSNPTVSVAAGGGAAHNNMSPYIIVNYEVVAG
jgi:microcystin-dependent protein